MDSVFEIEGRSRSPFYMVILSESAENKTEGGSTPFNGRKKQQWTLIFGMTIASGIILPCIIIYFYNRRKRINSQGNSYALCTLFY